MVRIQTRTYVEVPQHGSLSLHTKIEGPIHCKTRFPFPMVWPLNDFQGHGSWFVCKVALRAGSHRVLRPKFQFTWGQLSQSQPLRACKSGRTTSHKVPSLKSQVCHECLHGNAFWRWDLVLLLRVELSGKPDPTCNTHPVYFFYIKQSRSHLKKTYFCGL